MICPDCKGNGKVFAHVNTGPDSSGHYWGNVDCLRCSGSGAVPEVMRFWIERGKVLRDARLARDESLHEAAKRLGVGPAKLSAMEHGREPPISEHDAAMSADVRSQAKDTQGREPLVSDDQDDTKSAARPEPKR